MLFKVGRNDPCYCGSDIKYKKCCYGKSDVQGDDISSHQGKLDFNIVYDDSMTANDFQDGREVMATGDANMLKDIYFRVNSLSSDELKTSSCYHDIMVLITKYPQHPIPLNYLMVMYNKLDDDEKCEQMIKLLYEKYPRYLLGRLQYAGYLMYNDQYEAAFESMGRPSFIHDICPGRTTFHVLEVTRFYELMIEYYVNIKQRDEAKRYYDSLVVIASLEGDQRITAALQRARKWLERSVMRSFFSRFFNRSYEEKSSS